VNDWTCWLAYAKRDCEHDLYCCLLPRCEALRACRSGFPIVTIAIFNNRVVFKGSILVFLWYLCIFHTALFNPSSMFGIVGLTCFFIVMVVNQTSSWHLSATFFHFPINLFVPSKALCVSEALLRYFLSGKSSATMRNATFKTADPEITSRFKQKNALVIFVN